MSPLSRVVIGVVALALVLAPIATLHPAIVHLYDAGLPGLPVEASHPKIIALALLTVLSALPAAGFIVSLVTAAKAHRELQTLLAESEPMSLDGIEFRVLTSRSVMMFTAGIIHPWVFVTSAALVALDHGQLKAGLLHEQAHQRSRDVFWNLMLSAVGRGFAFLPGTSRMVEALMLRSECGADDYALRGGARRTDLFDAIAAASGEPANLVSVGLSSTNAQLRLVRLVNPETRLPGQPITALLSLAAVVLLPAFAAHVLAVAAIVCTTA